MFALVPEEPIPTGDHPSCHAFDPSLLHPPSLTQPSPFFLQFNKLRFLECTGQTNITFILSDWLAFTLVDFSEPAGGGQLDCNTFHSHSLRLLKIPTKSLERFIDSPFHYIFHSSDGVFVYPSGSRHNDFEQSFLSKTSLRSGLP